MDYKEKVIALLNSQELSKEQKKKLENIFPELKESDDVIRKDMLEYCYKRMNNEFPTITIHQVERWLSWLEKQGYHKKFRDAIQVGDKVTRNEDGVLVNLSQLNRVAKPADKQGEQKPADNVEPKFKVGDKIYLKPEYRMPDDDTPIANTVKEIIRIDDKHYRFDGSYIFIEDQDKYELVEQKPNAQAVVEAYNADIEWLNSIRPQNKWKPSDAQIASITCAVRKMKESACYDSELVSLFNDLKKLKE